MYTLQLELKCKSVLFPAQQWPGFPLLCVQISPGNKLYSFAKPISPSSGSWSKWLMTARRQHVMQDTHRTNCWEMQFMTERFIPTARKVLLFFSSYYHISWNEYAVCAEFLTQNPSQTIFKVKYEKPGTESICEIKELKAMKYHQFFRFSAKVP